VDDRVDAGLDPSAAQTSTARTWEAWVQTRATGRQTLFGRYRFAANSGPWFLRLVDGSPEIVLQSGSQYSQQRASRTVNDGAWHHVAAVWVPGVRLDVYVDGVLSDGLLQNSSSLLRTIDSAADV